MVPDDEIRFPGAGDKHQGPIQTGKCPPGWLRYRWIHTVQKNFSPVII